jgi:hypothetical protein
MSAQTIASPTTPETTVRSATRGTTSWPNVIRSEWTKLWSVKSTLWTLFAVFGLTIALSALISAATVSSDNAMIEAEDPTIVSLAGLDAGQLAIVVFGVMFISSEYATRSIRTSLIANPRRLRFLGAKALVLAVVALVVGVLTSFASFTLGQSILASESLNVSLSDPGVLRAVFGGGLYLAGSAMFGFALGALLRSTAAGISVAVACLAVLPPLLGILPGSWGETIHRYFTSNAGQQIVRVVQTGDSLSPWTGYLVFSLWWMVPLALAAILIRRRDV